MLYAILTNREYRVTETVPPPPPPLAQPLASRSRVGAVRSSEAGLPRARVCERAPAGHRCCGTDRDPRAFPAVREEHRPHDGRERARADGACHLALTATRGGACSQHPPLTEELGSGVRSGAAELGLESGRALPRPTLRGMDSPECQGFSCRDP